jgi:hypothetical protein
VPTSRVSVKPVDGVSRAQEIISLHNEMGGYFKSGWSPPGCRLRNYYKCDLNVSKGVIASFIEWIVWIEFMELNRRGEIKRREDFDRKASSELRESGPVGF